MEAAATAKVEHGPFPSVDKKHVEKYILPEIAQWSLSNGFTMAADAKKPFLASAAPTTVFPTPVPRAAYDNAKYLQQPFNKLYAKVANSQWLIDETAQLAKVDPTFTGKLFSLLKDKTTKSKQNVRFGIFRSDYLIEEASKEVKQVEFNTVSCSFPGLTTKAGELHAFLNVMGRYAKDGKPFYQVGELHVSESIVFLCRGIANALNMYQNDTSNGRDKDEKVVLFVVERDEKNLYDQKLIEYNLLKLYGISSIRATFDEIKTEFKHSGCDNKRLVHTETNAEVGVVYYRTGYDVADYHNEGDWAARGYLEESFAIKTPDLGVQLAGTKKIQQLLTNEKIISNFIDDSKTKKDLMKSFVKIYPLDNSPEGIEGKKLAFERPEHYVLKPQREGGGHNVYKKDIPAFLKSISEEQWSAYILMEIINTNQTTENYIVRDGELSKEPMISEMGIYGSVVFDKDNIHLNEYSGSLLRSKSVSSDEGGVVAGFGCIDSMYLF